MFLKNLGIWKSPAQIRKLDGQFSKIGYQYKIGETVFINPFWNLLRRVARKKNVLPAEKIVENPPAIDEQFVILKSRFSKNKK